MGNFNMHSIQAQSWVAIGHVESDNSQSVNCTSLPKVVRYVVGPRTVCPEYTHLYKVSSLDEGELFQWEVVGGQITGSSSGKEVSVTFNGPGPYQLRVWQVGKEPPYCTGPVKTITINADPVEAVFTGDAIVCPNSYADYSVSYMGADEYKWEITPHHLGSVKAGNGTRAVSVLWNNTITQQSATLLVRISKCGQYHYKTFPVQLRGVQPVVLSGAADVCSGSPFELFHDAPAGSSFLVDWGNGIVSDYPNFSGDRFTYTYPVVPSQNNVQYTVKVKITNPSFCVEAVEAIYTVTVKPSPAIAITPAGPFVFCDPNFNVSLNPSLQAGYAATTSMVWHFPGGVDFPCAVDDPACQGLQVSEFGQYSIEAFAANGCTGTSNIVSIVQNCGGPPTGCGPIVPSPEVSVDVLVNSCGTMELRDNHNTGATNTSWQLPPQLVNASITPGTLSSTVTGNINLAGQYRFSYEVTYLDVNNNACIVSAPATVTVPLIADLKTAVVCTTGGYKLAVFDHSTRFPAASIVGYDYYIDGTSYFSGYYTDTRYDHPAVLPPGSHVVKLVIHYSFEGDDYSCEKELALNLPALPVADFSFSMNNSCEGVPVKFTNLSNGYVTSFWDFRDRASTSIQDPERVFQFNQNGYNVTLTVRNSAGCIDDTSKLVDIVENHLDDDPKLVGPGEALCPGTTAMLTYSGQGNPNRYTWFNDDVQLFLGLAPTIRVGQTGNYYVVVSNANLCKATSNSVSVVVRQLPNPRIRGGGRQCVGSKFTLDGFAGNDLAYDWYRSDGMFHSSEPQIEDQIDLPGTYTYTLNITTPDGQCSKGTTHTVIVSDPPDPPSLGYSVSCQPYRLLLQASSATAGRFNWSNGASSLPNVQSSSVETPFGGPHKVWFTDGAGCTSSAEVIAPRDPEGYLWIAPAGCYSLCLPPGGINLPGTVQSFTYWQWLLDGSVLSFGTGSASPLNIQSVGNYQLSLQMGTCVVTSRNIQISEKDRCNDPDEGCDALEVEITLVTGTRCDLTFLVEINNNSQTDYSYTIFTNRYGSLWPAGSTAWQGSSHEYFTWTAPLGVASGHQEVEITVRVWLPGGRYCDFTRNFEYNCGAVPDLARTSGTEPGNPVTEKRDYNISLGVVPNPATTQATVQYTANGNRVSRLDVYNMLGVKVYSAVLSVGSGSAVLQTGKWPAGVYNIILTSGGAAVKNARLVVGR